MNRKAKQGIDWGRLGLMREWRKVVLNDVVSILGDGLHGTPKYDENGDYYFINGNNLQNCKIVFKPETKRVSVEEYEKYKKDLNNRTIFVSINGTLGNVAVYNGEKCILGKSACYFNVKNEVDKNFIKYVVSTDAFQDYILRFANGTTIKNVSLRVMREYQFELPPLKEQRIIATTLSALDEKIANNTAINHHLEQMAQAIFKSWFVDFEPFGGEMPDDWREGTLSEICSYGSERIAVSELTSRTYISTENMVSNRGGFLDAASLPTTALTPMFRPGNVLVSNIRPYFKKIIFCSFVGGCSADVLCFQAKSNVFEPYLYCHLYSDAFFDYMVAGSKGTKMPRGDKQQIMNYPTAIPSDGILADFVELIVPILSAIENNRDECRSLAALRDALLPRLMSGELSVADLDGGK